MTEEWQAFKKDTRVACKYGAQCYQRNPVHHQTYKHPPKNVKRKLDHQKPVEKRLKPAASPRKDADTGKEDVAVSLSDTDRVKEVAIAHGDVKHSNSDSSNTIIVNLPETISYHDKDDHNLLKELFLVEMPKDFYELFKCLEKEENFEKSLASVNLELIGPFDLLLGRLPVLDDKELYLIHWRFFYDPPEFQAVLKKKGKSEYHIGYFKDEPDKPPEFLANCDSSKSCQITPMADNIFGAIYLYLQNEKKSSPFVSVACQKWMDKIKKWAEPNNYSIEEYNIRKRQAKVLARTLHGAGIVVPYNKKTELGYRKLVETDTNLKKMFAKLESATNEDKKNKILSDLQPVITYANIAVDECDFGTGLEAGIDLFCSGIKELQPSALSILESAYSLLKRDAFASIVQAHLKYRRRGPNMSILCK